MSAMINMVTDDDYDWILVEGSKNGFIIFATLSRNLFRIISVMFSCFFFVLQK